MKLYEWTNRAGEKMSIVEENDALVIYKNTSGRVLYLITILKTDVIYDFICIAAKHIPGFKLPSKKADDDPTKEEAL